MSEIFKTITMETLKEWLRGIGRSSFFKTSGGGISIRITKDGIQLYCVSESLSIFVFDENKTMFGAWDSSVEAVLVLLKNEYEEKTKPDPLMFFKGVFAGGKNIFDDPVTKQPQDKAVLLNLYPKDEEKRLPNRDDFFQPGVVDEIQNREDGEFSPINDNVFACSINDETLELAFDDGTIGVAYYKVGETFESSYIVGKGGHEMKITTVKDLHDCGVVGWKIVP